MNNRAGETCRFCILRVYVERVGVAVESIQDSLIGKSAILYQKIMLSLGKVRNRFNFTCRFDLTSSQRSNKCIPVHIISKTFLAFFIDKIAWDSIDNEDPFFWATIDHIYYLTLNFVVWIYFQFVMDHIESFLSMQNVMKGKYWQILMICYFFEFLLLPQTRSNGRKGCESFIELIGIFEIISLERIRTKSYA